MESTFPTFSRNYKEFYSELKTKVDEYFATSKKTRFATRGMILKGFLFLVLYLASYALILMYEPQVSYAFLLVFVMIFSMSGIIMNVMHDALHGSFASSKWVNWVLGLTLYLAGMSSETWHFKHNVIHHSHTSVYGVDRDIAAEPAIRFSKYAKSRWHYRFQHWYTIPLYGFATIKRFLFDPFELHIYYKRGLIPSHALFWKKEAVLLSTKLFYVLFMFVLPLYVTNYSAGTILLALFFFHYTISMIMALHFQLAHLVEEVGQFDERYKDWAVHQMYSTANFATRNRFVTWFSGALNYQIEHHLFTGVCHVHYPAIAPIVKKMSKKYGLPYYEHPSFWSALISHVRFLKRLG